VSIEAPKARPGSPRAGLFSACAFLYGTTVLGHEPPRGDVRVETVLHPTADIIVSRPATSVCHKRTSRRTQITHRKHH